MEKYHKINTVFKRNPETNYKTLLFGEFSEPEFEYLQNNIWQFTEKVDGANIRIGFDGYLIEIKGKTDKSQIPVFLLEKQQKLFTLQKMNNIFPELQEEDFTIILYGEGYGAKIQKGGGNYIFNNVSFVLFDVKIGNWWLRRKDVEEIAGKLNIAVVPVIGEGTLRDMVKLAQKGFDSKWGKFLAEGIVARPKIELFARNGHRIITKIKYKDFRKGGDK